MSHGNMRILTDSVFRFTEFPYELPASILRTACMDIRRSRHNRDVAIGDPIGKSADSREFVRNLQSSYEALFERCPTCKAEED